MKKIRGIAGCVKISKLMGDERRLYAYAEKDNVRMVIDGNDYDIIMTVDQARHLANSLKECANDAKAFSP